MFLEQMAILVNKVLRDQRVFKDLKVQLETLDNKASQVPLDTRDQLGLQE